MSNTKRGWLIVAAALSVGASGIARADDGGDNGMNPMYGDSFAALQGQGHNVGTPRMAPEGALAAHEMDNQPAPPLIERMRQTQTTMAEQARRNWDAMVQKAHAMTDRMRTAMNTQSSNASSTDQATGATVVNTPAQPATDSGYKIAPVNPRGQAPTIVGPTGG